MIPKFYAFFGLHKPAGQFSNSGFAMLDFPNGTLFGGFINPFEAY